MDCNEHNKYLLLQPTSACRLESIKIESFNSLISFTLQWQKKPSQVDAPLPILRKTKIVNRDGADGKISD